MPLWLPLQPCGLCLLQGCCLHVLAIPACRGVKGRGEGQSSESVMGVVEKHKACQGIGSISLLLGYEGARGERGHGKTPPEAKRLFWDHYAIQRACAAHTCSLGHADKTMQRRRDLGGH